MATDEDSKPKASIKVSVGKEIDAAIGDVIRGLLKKPAEEAGNLIADGLGLFDLPLNFHPAATGARLVFTPIGAG